MAEGKRQSASSNAKRMIERLSVTNFKSVRLMEIPCRRVNVFIGEPNTGKTNILEALGMFCFETYPRLARVTRTTQSADLFWDQDLTQRIQVSIDEGNLTIDGSRGELNGSFQSPGAQDHVPGFRMDAALRLQSRLRLPLKQEIRYFLFDSITDFERTGTEILEPPFGSNIANLLYGNKAAREATRSIFSNSGFRLLVDAAERKLLITKEVNDVLFAFPYNSASETLRRMAFFNLAMETGGGQVLLFDEPEANAFPPFTKSIAERMALDVRSTQYFLTTHSPYMLDSLLAKCPADDLNIVFCKMENFETKTCALNARQKAKLMEWSMDSFFNFDRLLEEA
jgi:hypothetical protein